MHAWLRKWWPLLKALLALAILVAIGRQFLRDLRRPELWERTLHPSWLLLSALLYLVALGFSALYWYRLLLVLGQRPAFLATIRAHYIGQMGKYLPGKAWALLLRSNLVRSPTTQVGVAVLTSFYEVFVSMASGALLAVVLFSVQVRDWGSPLDWHLVSRAWQISQGAQSDTAAVDPRVLALLALLLLAVLGLPTLPFVFRRLVERLALPFRQEETSSLPTPGFSALLTGLAMTPFCWLLMGASLWSALRAADAAPVWSVESWSRETAYLALAYVSGFIIIFLPSGLGVREALLMLVLVPDISERLRVGTEEARALAVLTVLLLRVVWTAAELVVVAVLYWLPVSVTPRPAPLTAGAPQGGT